MSNTLTYINKLQIDLDTGREDPVLIVKEHLPPMSIEDTLSVVMLDKLTMLEGILTLAEYAKDLGIDKNTLIEECIKYLEENKEK
jgi:hypothetical protein